MTPRVILDPAFRCTEEVFTIDARRRLDEIADVVWGRNDPMPSDDFRKEVRSADAVVFGEWRHGPLFLDVEAPRLLAVLEVAGGHQHPQLGYDQALAAGIRVGSCAPAFGFAVAEMGLALALASVRGVARADRAMRNRTEQWLHDGNSRNSSLRWSTVGFIGCGGIATHLRALLEPFDVVALGFDPPLGNDETIRRGFTPSPLADLIERSDLIFVLAAPTSDNRHILSADLIKRLRPSQHVVMLSRAAVVDFRALMDHVQAGATNVALDVYDIEPLPVSHRVRDIEDAVLTPHLAGALPIALEQIGEDIVDDLECIFRGDAPNRLQYLDHNNASGLIQASRV